MIKRFWLPFLVFLAFEALLAIACFGRAPNHHQSPPVRPPRLFQNGEIARSAGTGKKVIVVSAKWIGHEWIYDVKPK